MALDSVRSTPSKRLARQLPQSTKKLRVLLTQGPLSVLWSHSTDKRQFISLANCAIGWQSSIHKVCADSLGRAKRRGADRAMLQFTLAVQNT